MSNGDGDESGSGRSDDSGGGLEVSGEERVGDELEPMLSGVLGAGRERRGASRALRKRREKERMERVSEGS